jgi:hypothetical protein
MDWTNSKIKDFNKEEWETFLGFNLYNLGQLKEEF